MASPFPGMDPYLEQSGAWRDFHSTFINYLRNAINERLPDAYDARIEERVTLIESFDDTRKSFGPGVIVGLESEASASRPREHVASALLEPVIVPLIIPEKERQHYIEIYDYPEQNAHYGDRGIVADQQMLAGP